MSIVAVLDGAERKVQREKGDIRWCPWCGTSHFKSSPDCPNCRAIYQAPADVQATQPLAGISVAGRYLEPGETVAEAIEKLPVPKPQQPKSKPKKKRR